MQFYQAIEAMQKAVKRFTTRCIVAVAIFFLPMLVNLIFSFPGMDAVRGVIFLRCIKRKHKSFSFLLDFKRYDIIVV